MDALTFAIEAIFALVFLAAVAEWWRRRDALSLDVVLVFGDAGRALHRQLHRDAGRARCRRS